MLGKAGLVSSRLDGDGDAASDWSQRNDWLASSRFLSTDRLVNSVFGAWVHADLDVGSPSWHLLRDSKYNFYRDCYVW